MSIKMMSIRMKRMRIMIMMRIMRTMIMMRMMRIILGYTDCRNYVLNIV